MSHGYSHTAHALKIYKLKGTNCDFVLRRKVTIDRILTIAHKLKGKEVSIRVTLHAGLTSSSRNKGPLIGFNIMTAINGTWIQFFSGKLRVISIIPHTSKLKAGIKLRWSDFANARSPPPKLWLRPNSQLLSSFCCRCHFASVFVLKIEQKNWDGASVLRKKRKMAMRLLHHLAFFALCTRNRPL